MLNQGVKGLGWTKLNFNFLLIDLNIWIHSSDHQSNIIKQINALTPWCSTCCSMPAGFSSKSSLSVAEVIMRQQDAIKASWYTDVPTIISVKCCFNEWQNCFFFFLCKCPTVCIVYVLPDAESWLVHIFSVRILAIIDIDEDLSIVY